MKKIILVLTLVFGLNLAKAQDVVTLHNGSTLEGKVSSTDGATITFTYKGEDVSTKISKIAINSITYASGRKQVVTEKLVLEGKDAFQKVILTKNPEDVEGLTRIGEVKGKTAFISYRTGANADKKSEERLKEDCYKLGGVVVLVTEDKDYAVGKTYQKGLGSSQTRMIGVAYKY
ncbi:MAG TPA: hypothetical protein PK218_02350 [Flavobacterium sp.]|jgi:hypothetical protein|uniref:hypothetical protein n=1 Tax=Flavobacterium sp. TaxID=239 RepID=UPI002BF71231|nr:hypothetical protein [Flavobacterium sp.]MCA0349938.1 hypothetical protein [Bacteroidota bacterium]HPW97380.1 hypothetical protein [Flavobacterium sp.]HQA74156.1 hypothetical protein [Flavobacterium sp.]